MLAQKQQVNSAITSNYPTSITMPTLWCGEMGTMKKRRRELDEDDDDCELELNEEDHNDEDNCEESSNVKFGCLLC